MKSVLGFFLLAISLGACPPDSIAEWFATNPNERGEILEEWSPVKSKESSEAARKVVWAAYETSARKLGWAEQFPVKAEGMTPWLESREVQPLGAILGEKTMPYVIVRRGEKPKNGWPLYFGLHGGGGNPRATGPHSWEVNSREWVTQMKLADSLYPSPGLYIIPRMADDREGRWYYGYNQVFLDRLIQAGILFGEVDPNRVYLMGISEGGYAAFRLGSLMADRWAGACAMAAAEPLSNAPPENMRHLAFYCAIGELDTGFDRIGLARRYFEQLEELKKDAVGEADFSFHFDEQKGKGHGIDYRPGPVWISQFSRPAVPRELAWTVIKQHDRKRQRLWWIALDEEPEQRLELTAKVEGQTVNLTARFANKDGITLAQGIPLRIYLDERLLDLDNDVVIFVNEKEKFRGKVTRSLSALIKSTAERGDPNLVFPVELKVKS